MRMLTKTVVLNLLLLVAIAPELSAASPLINLGLGEWDANSTQALMQAMRCGNFRKAERIVERYAFDESYVDERRVSLLAAAEQAGCKGIVRRLHERIVARTNIAAFMKNAAIVGNNDVIVFLREQGFPCDTPDEYGQRPLSHAAMHGHTAVVHTLVDAGVSLDAKDNNGMTALMVAACYKKRLLLKCS